MFKRQTRPLLNRLRRARGAMDTPGRRALAWFEAMVLDHGLWRAVKPNRHLVAPGLWRSAQPLPFQIRRLARGGLRTVVNLRGPRDCAAYLMEREACAAAGLRLVDFGRIASRDMPPREALRELDALFDAIEYPALVHCKSGADRAGLVAALYLLQRERRPLAEARRQLSLRYGHVRWAKTGLLDRFLDAFAASGETDIVAWAEGSGYDPPALKAHFLSRRWANLLVDRVLRRE